MHSLHRCSVCIVQQFVIPPRHARVLDDRFRSGAEDTELTVARCLDSGGRRVYTSGPGMARARAKGAMRCNGLRGGVRTETGTEDYLLRGWPVPKTEEISAPVTALGMTSLLLGAAMAALWLAAVPALAHHGAAEYDNTKSISLQGTVTQLQYLNPHA